MSQQSPTGVTRRAAPLFLFTRTEAEGHHLFRPICVDVAVVPGEGRIWLDVCRENRFDISWQRHLHNLAALGRAHYDLPWDDTDLHVSLRGKRMNLAGSSASLPLFVAWIGLLAGVALPEPILAAGVAAEGASALVPAPHAFVQGKLEAADALARQRFGGRRLRMWVPSGSDYEAGRLAAIEVRETPTLADAVRCVLGEGAPVERRGGGSGR